MVETQCGADLVIRRNAPCRYHSPEISVLVGPVAESACARPEHDVSAQTALAQTVQQAHFHSLQMLTLASHSHSLIPTLVSLRLPIDPVLTEAGPANSDSHSDLH